MRLSNIYIMIILVLMAGCSNEISYQSLGTHSNFPIPENVKQLNGKAKNPNIEKYVKYKWKEAGEIRSIPPAYLKVIKSKGWEERKEEQLGTVRFFEKNETIIALSTHDGFFTLSKLKNDSN